MSTLLNLDSYRHELFEQQQHQQQQQQQQQRLSSSPTYSVLSMESSTSSPSASETNKYYSSHSPSSTSNMSPQSTISDTSSFNMQNLNISASYHYYTPQTVGDDGQLQTFNYTAHGNATDQSRIELSVPHLVILEQPVDKFRFRYQSEMHGTHGSLMGVHTEKSKKTFPSVELCGFQGEAKIRCSLYQVDPSKRAAHSHHLVIKSGEIDLNDPHDIDVNAETGYVAMFQGMGIIHTAKKNIAEELCKKIKKQRVVEMNRELTLREEHQLQKEATEMAKTMNLNQVCLCFQAFQVDPTSGQWTQLCEPVYSNAINNMKSALTGELKICRLSSTVGSVDGGEEVFMFVEKVCKNNIKIRFYETDEYDQEVWQGWGSFSEADVHHQYAIAFKTPAYHNKDITEPVEVFMQLFRPRDKCQSEGVPFKFKPRPGMMALTNQSRKRPRVHSGNISNEIPTVVPNEVSPGPSRLPPLHQPFPMVQAQGHIPEAGTISKEFNKSGIIQEILESHIPTTIAGDISFSSNDFKDFVHCNSEELHKLINEIGEAQELAKLETDSVSAAHVDGEAARFERALEKYLDDNQQAKDVDILKKILAIIRLFRRDYDRCRELISALWMSSNKQKANCLHIAIERRDITIACKLIEVLRNYNLQELLDLMNERHENALHLAVSAYLAEIVDALLLAGANLNGCDYRGNSVLHRAVVEGSTESLGVLLEHCKRIGARLDATNDEGFSALHLACMCKNLRITRLLLERGASHTARDLKHGNNILHIAVESDSLDMVNYILENVDKTLSEKPNNAGYTALQLANAKHLANSNNKLIVKELLRFSPKGVLEKEPLPEDEDDEPVQNDEEFSSSSSSSTDSVLLSMNLTCNRDEVRRILEEHTISNEGAVLTPLKNVPYNIATDSTGSCLFDDECLSQLCDLLNRNQLWKEIGSLLDFNAFFAIWEQSSNPTGMLLNYFEMQKSKLDHLTDILQALDQKDAIHLIDEMVCRQMK
ncbi:nuclear factor NF-kappa-B p110 subunit isoform X2 [Topomyia yanbarensis]|uniref:nuclear factor NF-kappa-B p110 subunit isoform X2 n=1 Tax=Topomyia yanbarensis TaxID=2498891 RepID=UPI00273B862C|nr:nuclear factor NF-kappa-B p110 subunit isoform X2 [Topomyia yanbarensis]